MDDGWSLTFCFNRLMAIIGVLGDVSSYLKLTVCRPFGFTCLVLNLRLCWLAEASDQSKHELVEMKASDL